MHTRGGGGSSSGSGSGGRHTAAAQHAQLPRLIVLLDLDGTMVGSVTCAAAEHDLLRSVSQKDGPARIRAARSDLIARMRFGIIRPGLQAFCRQADAAHGVELFVYTASDDAWAAHIVPCVEAALGVRFNRPVLSRRHCVQHRTKSLARVAPVLARGLRGRYPGLAALKGAALRDAVVRRAVLVDNTPGILGDPAEHGRLIVCPTYAYAYVYDVLAHVDPHAAHSRFQRIARTLLLFGLLPEAAAAATRVPGATYQHFAAAYYSALAHMVARAAAGNASLLGAQGDRFFSALAAALLAPRHNALTEPLADADLRDVRRHMAALLS